MKKRAAVKTKKRPAAQRRRSTKSRAQAPRPAPFSPGKTARTDSLPVPDAADPLGVQGGRGPLNQEGEGERQNDQLAELEQIIPSLNREKKGTPQ